MAQAEAEQNEYDPEALARRRRAAEEDDRNSPLGKLPPNKPREVAEWIETTQRPILDRWDVVLRNLDHPKKAALGKAEFDLAKAEWRCRWSEARIAMWLEVAEALRRPPPALANLPGGLHHLQVAYFGSQSEGGRCEMAHPDYVKERTRLRQANAARLAQQAQGVELAKGNLDLAIRKIVDRVVAEERKHAAGPKDDLELARHAAAVAALAAKLAAVEQLRAAFNDSETGDPGPA